MVEREETIVDTTETYIKMADCPEIQAAVPKDNSLCLFSDGQGIYYRFINTESTVGHKIEVRFVPVSLNETSLKKLSKYIFLPSQDQLQQMIEFKVSKGDIQRLSRFYIEKDIKVSSMEQLWLAFVMYEKYKKIWNGTEWENG